MKPLRSRSEKLQVFRGDGNAHLTSLPLATRRHNPTLVGLVLGASTPPSVAALACGALHVVPTHALSDERLQPVCHRTAVSRTDTLPHEGGPSPKTVTTAPSRVNDRRFVVNEECPASCITAHE